MLNKRPPAHGLVKLATAGARWWPKTGATGSNCADRSWSGRTSSFDRLTLPLGSMAANPTSRTAARTIGGDLARASPSVRFAI